MKIYRVIFLFYLGYFILSILGNIFIDYDSISLNTISIYVTLFTFSAYFFNRIKKREMKVLVGQGKKYQFLL